MPLKAYFQDEAPSAQDGVRSLRLSVMVWHLCWASFTLAGLLGLIFLSASLFVLSAMVAITVPGAACVLLLSRDSAATRQLLMWVWGLCALIAVGLTGGISGPLAAWCALPLLAAVVLNQRVLISLGATLSFGVALFAILISVWHGIRLPDEQESFWLSIIANISMVAGFGLAVLPALRVRVERVDAAEDARARLLRMLTEQPSLLVCLEEDGRVVSAYGEAPPGLDLKSLLQLGLSASAHVPDRLRVKAALEQAMMDGRADFGFTPHAAMDHYVLLSLRKGADNRLYGVMSDGSLAHAHETALEAARADAESANQGKTQFLASMSHELRTPLNAVIGFSDIMRLQLFGEMPPKYAEYAQLIWESGQHVLDMINDVLDMSKIEAQRYELTLEGFDMREPVSAALRLIRGQAHEKAIDIVSHMPQTAMTVTADKRAIKQICLNLLSNAVKFTPQGGTVTLNLSQSEEMVDIVITDTGIGIAPDDLNRIGQPYEQSGPAEQRAMGTGLGLSIVKAMAHLLGGSMTLASQLGEGTTVTVRLPVVQSVEQPELPMPVPVQTEPQGVVQSLEAFARAALNPLHNPLEDITQVPESLNQFSDFVIRPPKS
ncbi:HAMP domain-containing sensor histidine kinase [Asticcacaulis sp. 201]|uniref:HAMP domain-containing sensor histidine kinase n=1 Tax=Asticcacaulis sp. 201 TaxID=3028787 RepID=UPI0029160A1E|nr:HAMP domain-containing sensor histidine kinase [Asticcacaulis sp. 201]MDV6331877.1 HAMP domain-containing sensor histidine kinase [Asticcacaulis sp. 201]